MALEDMTGTDKFIDDLVNTNPVGSTDPVSDVDGHIQGVKNVLLNSFPAVTGAVTSTHTELNILDGVTASTAELNLTDGLTATTAELNQLDPATAATTPTVAGGDSFVMDDADVGTVKVDIDNVDTYLAQTTKTLTNKTISGATVTTSTIDADNNTITNIGADEIESGSTETTQTGTQSTPYVIPSGFHWIQVDATYTLTFEIQMNSSWRTVESGIAALTPRFMWSDGTNMRVSATNDSGVVRFLSMD